MAEAKNTYVVVALGAFWHQGALVKAEETFEVTRKERASLVAAKNVRDATEEEVEAFRQGPAKAKAGSKAKEARTKLTVPTRMNYSQFNTWNVCQIAALGNT